MEPQYTIPQPDVTDEASVSSCESEVEVTEAIDLDSTPGDQLFLFQLPGNDRALLQQNVAQLVSDQELSTAPLQPGIEDDQGSDQDDFQLPAIWFDN